MREDHLITVDPVQGGWRVSCDGLQPLMFLSGSRAERHARALATRLAELGDDAEVAIHDRSSMLVGVQRYLAD